MSARRSSSACSKARGTAPSRGSRRRRAPGRRLCPRRRSAKPQGWTAGRHRDRRARHQRERHAAGDGKLPGPVTFAFPPYSPDIESMVTSARAGGHEVLLQTAMKPFDYPDNDPGPQTLLTTLNAEQISIACTGR